MLAPDPIELLPDRDDEDPQGERVPITAATIAGYAIGAAVGAALLAVVDVVLGSLIRNQVSAVVALAPGALIIEPLIAGNIESVGGRPAADEPDPD
jgi:hypothetical protein